MEPNWTRPTRSRKLSADRGGLDDPIADLERKLAERFPGQSASVPFDPTDGSCAGSRHERPAREILTFREGRFFIDKWIPQRMEAPELKRTRLTSALGPAMVLSASKALERLLAELMKGEREQRQSAAAADEALGLLKAAQAIVEGDASQGPKVSEHEVRELVSQLVSEFSESVAKKTSNRVGVKTVAYAQHEKTIVGRKTSTLVVTAKSSRDPANQSTSLVLWEYGVDPNGLPIELRGPEPGGFTVCHTLEDVRASFVEAASSATVGRKILLVAGVQSS